MLLPIQEHMQLKHVNDYYFEKLLAKGTVVNMSVIDRTT